VNNTLNVNKRITLIIATMASFLTPFMGSSVSIALPSIGREFEMNAVLLSWIPASFLLSAAMFLVPAGRIADIHGRKKIFTYGIFIFTLSALLMTMLPSAIFLISFRFLQGIGSSMIFGTAVAILLSVFPAGERGKALGINAASVFLGLSLGPLVGGFLTQHFGWRSIFLATIPVGLIVITLIFLALKGEWAEARGERFDLGGSIIYSLTLLAIMCGLSLLPAPSGLWLILIGILGIFAFIRWEIKAINPILGINLFRNNRAFSFSNLAAFINHCATYAVVFLLSLYLQYIKGLSPQKTGLILVFQPVVMTIFSPFAGRLSDRIRPRIVASIGMALTALGLFFLTSLNEKTDLEFIVACLILLGFGLAFFASPNTNAVMSSVGKKFYGVASGTLGTMRLTGQMLSMGIAMLLFAIYIGKVQITPEYHQLFMKSVKAAFIIFATLCSGGIFVSLARGKVR